MSDSAGATTIRPLAPADDRSRFRCGDIELDRFFHRYAGQNQFRHHLGSTYVAEIEGRIGGFVTVTVGELAAESVESELRARLPKYPLPVLRIARLAVDTRFQGVGLGRHLLRAALELALELRDRVGCTGVVVDAKPAATDFYERLGFKRLETLAGELGDRPEPVPMFLPIGVIARVAGDAKAHSKP